MGQSLSEPKTEKETFEFGNGDYAVAVSGMQGWRQGEASVCVLSILNFIYANLRHGGFVVSRATIQSSRTKLGVLCCF